MLDTRAEINALLGRLEFSSGRALTKVACCTLLAVLLAFLPEHPGLTDAARWVLFILVLAAGMWISEAIPAFAVALLVIALEIAILGKPGGVFATGPNDWETFVRPWSSPLLWLFFGGLVLAEAAARTGLDRWLSGQVLGWFGNRPGAVLLGTMTLTGAFSMFMSNTATTAMMLAVMAPVLKTLEFDDPFIKALLLGVPFAANLGGMGTIIGTPPNAIAAGSLAATHPVTFTMWMVIGIPPAILLSGITWFYLLKKYPCKTGRLDLSALRAPGTNSILPLWKRILVMAVFFLTVGLWMTGPFHGIPTPVVSFLPISIFAATGVIRVQEIRSLHWDVLLLIAGGLSLGVAVSETGLATWIVGLLPIGGLGSIALALVLAYLAATLSNVMSNTAAANVLVPIGIAIGATSQASIVIPIALGASAAMCLPISTPPNAIAFTSGKLNAQDFLRGGLLMGFLAPAIVVLWSAFILR
ncbi:MAG: DASS family sodium-coupled anion symporter [bacterium]|nr:DASS family sodium-coupled anion symporter [bacterium]